MRVTIFNPNSEMGHESERPCRAPGAVGRVTPCAPRLQPVRANFPRRRFPNPLPIAAFLGFFVTTSVFGFNPGFNPIGWLRRGIISGCWICCLLLPLAGRASLAITNVSVVNITPASFSLVWAESGAGTASVAIFSDAGGQTNLAGTLGLEFYPVHTGDPAQTTNAYFSRLSQTSLQQKTAGRGLVLVRLTGCQPATTYYYRLQLTNSLGQQATWPASGPLPSVTTARETSFVLDSRQLVLSLPGVDPSGSVVILSNSNTPSLLAAVAGDGVPGNQVYFSVSDLLDASGSTNFLPLGTQEFTATVLSGSSNLTTAVYSLGFSGGFEVGSGSQFALGNFAVLSLGSAVAQAGTTAAIPLTLDASGITNFSYVLDLPTNRFGTISLQPISPQLGAATVLILNSNQVQMTFAATAGQTLFGNQPLAQLNLAIVTNQSSAFLPLVPQSLQGVNPDGSAVSNFAVQSGRLVIVASQPLLEALYGPNQTRNLALYGNPGAAYQVQSSTNLALASAWQDAFLTPMTNLMQVFADLDPTQPRIFYRAHDVLADPPILQLPQNQTLLFYGRSGTNYVVQGTTNLSNVLAWHPLLSYTLTNSFQFVNNLGTTNPMMFYRVFRP